MVTQLPAARTLRSLVFSTSNIHLFCLVKLWASSLPSRVSICSMCRTCNPGFYSTGSLSTYRLAFSSQADYVVYFPAPVADGIFLCCPCRGSRFCCDHHCLVGACSFVNFVLLLDLACDSCVAVKFPNIICECS